MKVRKETCEKGCRYNLQVSNLPGKSCANTKAQKNKNKEYKYTNTNANTQKVSNLPGRSWARAAFMLEVPVLKK